MYNSVLWLSAEPTGIIFCYGQAQAALVFVPTLHYDRRLRVRSLECASIVYITVTHLETSETANTIGIIAIATNLSISNLDCRHYKYNSALYMHGA